MRGDRTNKLKKEIRSIKKDNRSLEKERDKLKQDREQLFNIIKLERKRNVKYLDEFQMSMVAMGFDMSNVQQEFFESIRKSDGGDL